LKKLLKEIVVTGARPSPDKSRRSIVLTGDRGETHTLVACEQRTAIAWMEALDMVLGRKAAKQVSRWCLS